MKRLMPVLALIIAAGSAGGCTPSATQVTPEQTEVIDSTPAAEAATPTEESEALMDYAAFVAALEGAGQTVEEVGPTSGSLFTGAGHIIKVNGVEVQVFEYADAEALEAQAALISSNGSEIGGPQGVALVDWVDMPHFFKNGRILVIYIGRDEGTLSALKGVLGERFAGGTVEAWGPAPATSTVVDAASLAEALEAAGATVEMGEDIEQGMFSVAGQIIKVNGQDVQVFTFADEDAASADAATISPDGGMIGKVAVRWMAPPHFYRSAALIVLYVGDDAAIIDLLGGLLGTPFAG